MNSFALGETRGALAIADPQVHKRIAPCISEELKQRCTACGLRFDRVAYCTHLGRNQHVETNERPEELVVTSVNHLSVLILFLRCTTNVLLEYCLDGHLSMLRPCLCTVCGPGQYRRNP